MFCTLPQGDNATFVYSMLGCGKRFATDPFTGVITVRGLLDREEQENFSIVVSRQYSPLSLVDSIGKIVAPSVRRTLSKHITYC